MGKYSFGKSGPTFEGTSLVPAFASVATTATPATGSCAVQFVFKDVFGNAVAVPVTGVLYLSTSSSGLTHNLATTSFAKLTNGDLTNLGGAGPSLFTTTAAGLLGVTITAVTGSYYVVFVKLDGSLLISTICTVN